MNDLTEYEFSISASYAECEHLYLAGNNTVVVKTSAGLSIQLPSKNLRPFVGPNGIHGKFKLIINQQHKIQSLNRV